VPETRRSAPISFHIYVTEELDKAIRARAEEHGLSIVRYIRLLLERETTPDPDERFVQHFKTWWGVRGQGDPQQIVGAEARAQSLRMTFAHKFRTVVKQFLDQGLL